MRVLAVFVALMFVGASLQQSIAPVNSNDCLSKAFGLMSVFKDFNIQTFLIDQRYNKQIITAVLDTVKTCVAVLPIPRLAQSVSCKSLLLNAVSLMKSMVWDLTSRNFDQLSTDMKSFMSSISTARSVCL